MAGCQWRCFPSEFTRNLGWCTRWPQLDDVDSGLRPNLSANYLLVSILAKFRTKCGVNGTNFSREAHMLEDL